MLLTVQHGGSKVWLPVGVREGAGFVGQRYKLWTRCYKVIIKQPHRLPCCKCQALSVSSCICHASLEACRGFEQQDKVLCFVDLHTCIILLISPTRCTFLLNIFISLLCMFRVSMCPSSGENHCIQATLVFCHSVEKRNKYSKQNCAPSWTYQQDRLKSNQQT